MLISKINFKASGHGGGGGGGSGSHCSPYQVVNSKNLLPEATVLATCDCLKVQQILQNKGYDPITFSQEKSINTYGKVIKYMYIYKAFLFIMGHTFRKRSLKTE